MLKCLLTTNLSESNPEHCQQIIKQRSMEAGIPFFMQVVRATSKLCRKIACVFLVPVCPVRK